MRPVTHHDLVELTRRLQSEKSFEEFRKAQLSKVVEWRWATGAMLPQVPHAQIVTGDKPDKWTKTEPKDGWHHGLDGAGRIVYVRVEGEVAGQKYAVEQFRIHEQTGFFWVSVRLSDRNILGARWYTIDGERWLGSWELNSSDIRQSILTWEGSRFVSIEKRSWQIKSTQDFDAAMKATVDPNDVYSRSLHTYLYSSDGELERVLESHPPSVEYIRLPKGLNLKKLLAQVEDLLVEQIPQRVKEKEIGDTAYALLVQYTGVDTDPCGFGPPLMAVSVAARDKMLSKYPDNSWMLWSGPDLESLPGVTQIATANPELDEKLQLIFQLTIMPLTSNYAPVRKMFQNVCGRLNARDWAGILNVTDDFVVLPSDPHGEMDLRQDFKKCVPADRLRTLMERGFIGRMKIG